MDSRQDEKRARRIEMRKPIAFLEQALNEFKLYVKEAIKNLTKDVDFVEKKGDELASKLSALSKSTHKSEQEYQKLSYLLDEKVDKSDVEQIAQKHNDEVRLIMKDMVSDIAELHANIRQKSQENSEQRMEVNQIKILCKELARESQELRNELKNVKENNQVIEAAAKKSQLELSRQAASFFENADRKSEIQHIELEQINKAVQKSDKRIKEDSKRLHEEIKIELAQFMKTLREELNQADKRRRLIEEKMDTIRDEMIQVKNSKSEKDIDDFLKQVGYNAVQIAKLQQRLDGE